MAFDNAAGVIDDTVSRNIVDTNLLGPIRLTSTLIEHLKLQPRATAIHNTSVMAYVSSASRRQAGTDSPGARGRSWRKSHGSGLCAIKQRPNVDQPLFTKW